MKDNMNFSREADKKLVEAFEDNIPEVVYDEDYKSEMTPRRALDILMKTYRQSPLFPTYEAERTRGLAMKFIAEVLLDASFEYDMNLREESKEVL